MNFRQLTLEETKEWYEEELCEAFAVNERKPLGDILSLIGDRRYELWGLFQDDMLLGYGAIWMKKEIPLVLLDYLGVSKNFRNRGLGTIMLDQLKKQKPFLLLESELPVLEDGKEENTLRERRIRFYEKNQFLPVYEMATCGMRWQALLYDEKGYDKGDVMRWHKEIYGKDRNDVIVPLPKGQNPPLPYWIKSGESTNGLE